MDLDFVAGDISDDENNSTLVSLEHAADFARIQETQAELEEKQILLTDTLKELEATRTRLASVHEENDSMLTRHRRELETTELRIACAERKCYELTEELARATTSREQHQLHMEDGELITAVRSLRLRVSNFATQYFGGTLPRETNVDRLVDSRDLKGWRQLSKFLGNRDITISYMGSDRRRPCVVQALIWDTVYWAVFGEALWAGREMSNAFKNLSEELQQSAKTPGSDSDIEACRRFSLWRAETAAMAIEIINSSRAKQESCNEFFLGKIESVCNYICKHLVALTKTIKGIHEEVFDILQEAVKLDEAMKRQAVRLEWIFPEPQKPFDSYTMTLASGETWDADMDGVCLTTSPGLVRQGKSTGDDFGIETRLLSSEVSWSPSPTKFYRNSTV
ncbi:hypothetical protein K4K54_000368 [Colletotrichum sp. SAR 10_86]|nr:hypothetical protein K4K54_000368 [Colletotrichum sp. SAR 10_86]